MEILEMFPQVFCFPKSRINEKGGNVDFCQQDFRFQRPFHNQQSCKLMFSSKQGTVLLLAKKLIQIMSKSVFEHFYFIQKNRKRNKKVAG